MSTHETGTQAGAATAAGPHPAAGRGPTAPGVGESTAGTERALRGKSSRALALLVIAVLTAGCRDTTRGVALGLFDPHLTPRRLDAELAAIRDLGADGISLPVYWSQVDVNATRIVPYAGPGFDAAAYESLVRTAVRHAHEHDLSVFLVPVVRLQRRAPGRWRGAIEPDDWDAWFASYRRFLRFWTRLAAEGGVERLAVGSELSSTEGFRRRWQDLIAAVRRGYDGELTYSANWDHYRQVTFWDDLDLIGISGYWALTDEVPVTDAALYRGWARVRGDLEAWQREVGKPLLFTELGYPTLSTAAHAPWDYTRGVVDPGLQRRCYRAFFDTWRDSRILSGTYLWLWEPGRDGRRDRGYAWRGKPAAADIEAWYREG